MHRKYPLCSLTAISRLKDMDGWGILNTHEFNSALLTKSFWRAINGTGIWNAINRAKYIHGDALYLICSHDFSFPRKISCIWGGFKFFLDNVAPQLIWHFHDGSRIPIGSLNFLPLLPQSVPSHCLLHALTQRGIMYFSQDIYFWSF